MIRVLHIVTYMGRGGLETMLMNYYRHIDRSKVQFDFLVHRDFEADYDQEILSMGGKIYHVSRLVPWSRGYREELKRFFRAHPEYRIVHVHQDCLSSVALQCAEECGVPVRIVHSHNSNQDKNIKYLIKQHYMKQIPQFATDFFACGIDAGDWMFAGHPYQILHNAIDLTTYVYSSEQANAVRKKLCVEQNFVLGHVGRFDDQKNHAFLLDIFSEFLKIVPNAKLLLVGDGEGKIRIKEKAKALGLEDKVIFTGVRSDVSDLLQAMDVFVFPSLYEGVPVTMIEAQASGLPCVISDGVPDECVITSGLVTMMKLSDSSCDWAKHIKERLRVKRENHLIEIQAAGYDIITAARTLENFYLAKYGENL
ncbi:MAG: glycosyltransferase family 1 protein [Fusicatenibacter sp.]